MNTARIVVLTIALLAGGVAAYLASGLGNRPPPTETVTLQTVDVLVAKSVIGLGQTVTAEAVQWQTSPLATFAIARPLRTRPAQARCQTSQRDRPRPPPAPSRWTHANSPSPTRSAP